MCCSTRSTRSLTTGRVERVYTKDDFVKDYADQQKAEGDHAERFLHDGACHCGMSDSHFSGPSYWVTTWLIRGQSPEGLSETPESGLKFLRSRKQFGEIKVRQYEWLMRADSNDIRQAAIQLGLVRTITQEEK